MKYIVENTMTEKHHECKTWSAAMRAAERLAEGDESNVVIIERDRDGERTYNLKGQVLNRDGHWCNHY